MVIHVVKEGETVQSIADSYGITVERLILENEIMHPDRLVIGETFVVQIPNVTYIVQQGDTLRTIADKFGVSVYQLLRNNPYLSDREYIYPGETIVISYQGDKIGPISMNGYAYPFIDMDVLKKTLPFLTYLTVYSYQVTAEGDIITVDDTEIIQMAKIYGVAPVMMLTASAQTQDEEIAVLHSILTDKNAQERFFDNLHTILNEKEYYGVTINTPYINPGDRDLYITFITSFSKRASYQGKKFFLTFSIRIFQVLTGIIFLGMDFNVLNSAVDGYTLITYEFGAAVGIPPGTVAVDNIKRALSSALELIPAEKTDFGVQNIGYVWKLPYDPSSRGLAVSYDRAIQIAFDNGAAIQFDEITNVAYFEYSNYDDYVVRFWDARSFNNFAKLVPEFGLNGLGVWNIMIFFPQLWQVINSQFEIRKVIPEI